MRKRTLFLALAIAAMIWSVTGCGTSSVGFNANTKAKISLPANIPHVVVIAPLSGDVRVTRAAADQFADGLKSFGFDVIGMDEIEASDALKLYPKNSFLDSAKLAILRENFHAEGVFVGNVVSKAGVDRAQSIFQVSLKSILAGETLWSAQVSDPKKFSLDRDITHSVERSVDEALGFLENDLKILLKNQKKERKRQEKVRKRQDKLLAKREKQLKKQGENGNVESIPEQTSSPDNQNAEDQQAQTQDNEGNNPQQEQPGEANPAPEENQQNENPPANPPANPGG